MGERPHFIIILGGWQLNFSNLLNFIPKTKSGEVGEFKVIDIEKGRIFHAPCYKGVFSVLQPAGNGNSLLQYNFSRSGPIHTPSNKGGKSIGYTDGKNGETEKKNERNSNMENPSYYKINH